MPSVAKRPRLVSGDNRPKVVDVGPLRRPFAGLRRMDVQAADAADAAVPVPKQAAMTSPGVPRVIAVLTLLFYVTAENDRPGHDPVSPP